MVVSGILGLSLAGATVAAAKASARGVGTEEPRDDPVSVRQESMADHGFFGSWTGRSHWGGGIKGGK
jgi:hypothetical protein